MMNRPADREVAMAIDMTILCRELGALPGPGGLLDQDSYHVWLLQETIQAMNKKEKRDMDQAEAKAKRKH
jgi:hypothetical protein